MSAKSHTDLVVLDTIVHLIRVVPRHLKRDQLESTAANLSALAETPLWAGASENFNKLAWEAKVHILAAQGRFPRPGDYASSDMAAQIIDQIREMQAGKAIGYPFPGDIAIREAIQISLERNGFDLNTLPLPPTLYELIDRGDERPDDVSPARWGRAVAAYNHAMTIENSPGAVDHEDYLPEWEEDSEEPDRELMAELASEVEEEEIILRI